MTKSKKYAQRDQRDYKSTNDLTHTTPLPIQSFLLPYKNDLFFFFFISGIRFTGLLTAMRTTFRKKNKKRKGKIFCFFLFLFFNATVISCIDYEFFKWHASVLWALFIKTVPSKFRGIIFLFRRKLIEWRHYAFTLRSPPIIF